MGLTINQEIIRGHIEAHPGLTVEEISEDLDMPILAIEGDLSVLAGKQKAQSAHEVNVGYTWRAVQ